MIEVLISLLAVVDAIELVLSFSVQDLSVPTWGRVSASLGCLWGLMLTNGLEHAVAYNPKGQFEALGFGLHEIDTLQEWAYYGLAALAGVPFLAILGASFAGRMLFQGPINLATQGSLFGEGSYFAVWGLHIPKVFAGKSQRIEQMGIGLALLTASLAAFFTA